MTHKYIAGFFLMIFLSNYFNFVGFYKILQNLPGAPGKKMREKTRAYFITMNVLYVLTAGMSFIPDFGPFCRAGKVYPACMNWAACLFIINFVFHCVISCRKGYFLEEGSIIENESEAEELLEADDRSNVSNKEENLDWTDAQRADFLRKKMFKK